MAKATGAEIRIFWEDNFPKGYYHEPGEIQIANDNGDFLLEPEQKYDLNAFGYLVQDQTDGHSFGDTADAWDFQAAFLKWRRESTTSVIIVEVPKDQVDTAKAKISELGYKISR